MELFSIRIQRTFQLVSTHNDRFQDEEVNEKAVLGSGKPGDKEFHVLAL